MVRRLVTQDLCDDCDFHDLPGVEAAHEHVLAVDGDRPRRVLLCPRCEVTWAPVLAVYRERGQDTDPVSFGGSAKQPVKQPVKQRARKAPKAVQDARPKELENVPTQKADVQEKDPAAKKAKLYVVCPEDHASLKHPGPKRVAYEGRNTHAPACHNGAAIWDIVWGDPDGILNARCTSHAECVKVGLGFTSEYGMQQHVRACPLPRIDQPSPDETLPLAEDEDGHLNQQEPR